MVTENFATTINFTQATSLAASGAQLTIDNIILGGGYGSTGVTISNTGNIQANGTLTIDGISTLTGNVTTAGDIAVNGGDITTTSTGTVSLFNTNATGLDLAGAATTISIGASTGLTTINNSLTVSDDLTVNGAVLLQPGGTNDITLTTDSDSILTISGLPTATGNLVCIDNGTSQITKCAADAISLQSAYDGGNTITTTGSKNIIFNLASNDSFVITSAAGTTGGSRFILANGSNPTPPTQLVLIDNADTNQPLGTGLLISSSGGGGVTTAIDVSDSDITTGISLGSSSIAGTNFSVAGATGDITAAGDLALNGNDITTTTAADATVFNTNATTLSMGGDAVTYTIGATTATGNIRGTTINLPNATLLSATSATANFNQVNVGGGYGSTILLIPKKT
jgi:hypothetical protein